MAHHTVVHETSRHRRSASINEVSELFFEHYYVYIHPLKTI